MELSSHTDVTAVARVGKVLLINYAGYFLTANTFVPDNSLGSLAAMLQRHGIAVEIIDYQSPRELGAIMDHAPPESAQGILEALDGKREYSDSLAREYLRDRNRAEEELLAKRTEALLAKIKDDGVTLVGFKLWAGAGLKFAVNMAEAIKRVHPTVTLVAGGPAIQYAGDAFFNYTRVFDRLVPGEGETALLALARGESAGASHAKLFPIGAIAQRSRKAHRDAGPENPGTPALGQWVGVYCSTGSELA